MASPPRNRLKSQLCSVRPGVQRPIPHSLPALQWPQVVWKTPPCHMALPVTSLQPVLGLLHQSLSPLRLSQSLRSVPAPSSQLPHSTNHPHIQQTHTGAGWLRPAFHPEVLSFQTPSSRMFSFSDR